jgi:branched-chain amino acid transport system substrate-binding protein
LAAYPHSARAQSKPTISIGVLTDLSGTYRDNTGPTSVARAQQAVAEFTVSPYTSNDSDETHIG